MVMETYNWMMSVVCRHLTLLFLVGYTVNVDSLICEPDILAVEVMEIYASKYVVAEGS